MWPVFLMTVALLAAANDHECVKSIEETERIRSLAIEAIDQAFKIHIAQLYGIRLHDHTDAPRRAYAGIKNGLHAYHRARADIMAWNPPICR